MLWLAPYLALLFSQALWSVFGRLRFIPLKKKSPREARVSIIIPARNEEHNLPRLFDSLAQSWKPPLEIIVVDDDSSDGTAQVAQAHGAKVISPPPLPDDWRGKPWACQTGAKVAKGDWLLFLDADLWFEDRRFPKLLPLADDPNVVTSICPYHRIESKTEELSCFFNLIMAAGSSAFGKSRETRSALFGQCLLISQKAYQAVDGHTQVRDKVLENFHLASHLREAGFTCQSLLGKGVISMRMFTQGLPELWASWKKGFTTGAQQTHPRTLLAISLWLTAGMMIIPCAALIALTGCDNSRFQALTAFIYLFFSLQCFWAFRQVGTFSIWSALFFPVGLLFYQTLFFTALLEKKRGIKTSWKGRDVS